jgi:NADPH2:quinone reductase
VRAIGFTEYGGPEVLRDLHLPSEPVAAGDVRIKVSAATVNATDSLRRSGLFAAGARTPATGVEVAGMEVAGVVTEIGDAVRVDLRPGDRVMGIVLPSGEHGGYREDVVIPAASVSRVPAGASDVAAATLPMNGLTALQALDSLRLHPGQVLAVTGAAGALGGYVVQLGKAAGLTVIADASDRDTELVASLGADIVVRRGIDVADRIRKCFPSGVDGLVDGALLYDAVLPAVKDDGVVATARQYRGVGERALRFARLLVPEYAERQDKLEQLRQLAEDGHITLRVAATYPASAASEAHRRLEAGGTRGRLVLVFTA